MNGLELQRDLAAAHKPVPVIFVSACADPDEALLSAIHGAVDDKESDYE